jgi:hypothetical protein
MGMLQMKIIFMFLLISSVFCHISINPEPKSLRAIMMEEVILQKNPQMLLHFVIDDLILYEKGFDQYLKNTAWRTGDFLDYFHLTLTGCQLDVEEFEEYISDTIGLRRPFGLDRMSILRESNISILKKIVNKIDIQPAIEVLESFSLQRSMRVLELKMLREEKYGEKKKYLDYLYEFTLGNKQLFPSFTYLLERYTEAAAEEERFYEAIKNTDVSYREDYLKLADHLRAYRGRTEHESLLGALYSEDRYLFGWAFSEIKKKKISALYEEVFKSCRDSVKANWGICESIISDTPFDEP